MQKSYFLASILIGCCVSHAGADTAKLSFEAASVPAAPGLQCKLFPEGRPTESVPVATDDDGYARFFAVKPSGQGAVTHLTLDCKDESGKTSSYVVDLSSSETFASRPFEVSKEKGTDRPPLKGDPASFTQRQLIELGYGLRPDKTKNPAAYERWLAAATKSGRMLEAKYPDLHSHTITAGPGGPWVGSVMTGKALYPFTEATFNVPNAIPGGDGTSVTEVAIWNGLGGYGTGAGLIQGGVISTRRRASLPMERGGNIAAAI